MKLGILVTVLLLWSSMALADAPNLSRFAFRTGVERMEVRAIAIYRPGGCEERVSPAEERRPSRAL
jgi:hypothetical protein